MNQSIFKKTLPGLSFICVLAEIVLIAMWLQGQESFLILSLCSASICTILSCVWLETNKKFSTLVFSLLVIGIEGFFAISAPVDDLNTVLVILAFSFPVSIVLYVLIFVSKKLKARIDNLDITQDSALSMLQNSEKSFSVSTNKKGDIEISGNHSRFSLLFNITNGGKEVVSNKFNGISKFASSFEKSSIILWIAASTLRRYAVKYIESAGASLFLGACVEILLLCVIYFSYKRKYEKNELFDECVGILDPKIKAEAESASTEQPLNKN